MSGQRFSMGSLRENWLSALPCTRNTPALVAVVLVIVEGNGKLFIIEDGDLSVYEPLPHGYFT